MDISTNARNATRRLTETMIGAVHEYVNSCPKFTGNQLIEFEQILNKLEILKISRDKTLEEIALIEDQIKQTIFPTELKGKWIEVGQHRLRVTGFAVHFRNCSYFANGNDFVARWVPTTRA